MGMSLNTNSGRSNGGRRRSRSQMSDINVTPFVDVMLVLLIVFMVTAPLLTAGVQVDLPTNNAAPVTNSDDKPIEVSLTKEGGIFVGETEVTIEKLGGVLSNVAKENNQDQRIFVRGDKGIAYGDIMELIGTISEAGFTKIALVSEPVGN
ncbi:MAG: protein TolR [Micavibrio sp.]|nr:protein TolR [Micavibrio sp.]